MYLIARLDTATQRERDWLLDLMPNASMIRVTRTRENARRFKSLSDAERVCQMAARAAPDDFWQVVNA